MYICSLYYYYIFFGNNIVLKNMNVLKKKTENIFNIKNNRFFLISHHGQVIEMYISVHKAIKASISG